MSWKPWMFPTFVWIYRDPERERELEREPMHVVVAPGECQKEWEKEGVICLWK